MTKPPMICPNCGRAHPAKLQALARKHGLPWCCSGCRYDLSVDQNRIARVKRGRSDNQKRSIKQEKRVAEREGGRRQPASGAMPGFEGDVRVSRQYRGECKLTRKRSYTLKLDELEKLELQAYRDELPVLDLEFQDTSSPKRYVIMPEWVFNTLMDESGRRKKSGD